MTKPRGAVGQFLKQRPPEKRRVAYVRVVCEMCGVERDELPSIVRAGNGRFCSVECARRERVTRRVVTVQRPEIPPPAGHVPLPTLRWPDERQKAPRQCPHCGSRMLEIDAPYGLQKRGEVRCQMCTRTLCLLAAGWGNRASAEIVLAEIRCRDCGELTGSREDAPGRKRLYCPPCKRRRDDVITYVEQRRKAQR